MNDARRFSIPADVEAEMTPAVRAFVQGLLTRMAELETRLGKTPENSSLPPRVQHPHAKPPTRKPKSKQKRGGQPGHVKHERPLLSSEACDDIQTPQADRVPAVRHEVGRQRPRAVAASSLGVAPDQAHGHRVSTTPPVLPALRRVDLCRIAGGRADESGRSAAGGVGRAVDGLLSPRREGLRCHRLWQITGKGRGISVGNAT